METSPLQEAKTAFKNGKVKFALSLVRKLNQSNQISYYSIVFEALCFQQLGMLKPALTLLQYGLKSAPNNHAFGNTCNNLALTSIKLGDYQQAERYWLLAISKVTDKVNAPWRFNLAKLYFDLREFTQAMALCESLRDDPALSTGALHAMVNMSLELSDYKKTMSYLQALTDRLDLLEEKDLLGLMFSLTDHSDVDVTPLFNEAKRRKLNPHWLNTLEARRLIQGGQEKQALQLLNTVTVAKFGFPEVEAIYHELKGKALNKLEDYDAAFVQFNAMNKIAMSFLPANWKQKDLLKPLYNISCISDVPNDTEAPCEVAFLIGFPRSGTTLLENVLDSQQNILVLGEKATIDKLVVKMRLDGFRYPVDLNNLTEGYINELRKEYFSEASKYLVEGQLSDYQLLVDKNPFLTMKLPLILTLFPNAKILFAVRHPLDVVLSCYMQNFKSNLQLGYFNDWESCFQRYKDVLDLYCHYQKHMQWDEYRVFYERLVDDFEIQMENIFNFLAVPFDKDTYLAFSKNSKNKIINTPSRDQVKQGIYQNSKQRWKLYAEYMHPHWKLLRPYIKDFGYTVDILEPLSE